jgi:uncharacterized membrane protein YdbT with pleckstrin-like domain
MQDMMVYRDAGTRTVDKYLMSHEGRVIAVRRHPAVLLFPLLTVVGGLVLCGFAATLVGTAWIWWLWVLTLGYLAWKVIAWSVEFFLVTEHRVMVIKGVLNRNVAMMPLSKVTDIALERSLAGRMQALRNVGFMPYPEQLYLEVSGVIFGAEDGSPD